MHPVLMACRALFAREIRPKSPALAGTLRPPMRRFSAGLKSAAPGDPADAARRSRGPRPRPCRCCPGLPAAYFANSPPNPCVDVRRNRIAAGDSAQPEGFRILQSSCAPASKIRRPCRIPTDTSVTLGPNNMAKGRTFPKHKLERLPTFRARSYASQMLRADGQATPAACTL
jgi:hypothetical protein